MPSWLIGKERGESQLRSHFVDLVLLGEVKVVELVPPLVDEAAREGGI